MADRIFPNRIQEEALDSDLVFQGIDWDNFNERLAKAKAPKKMDDETKKMLQELGDKKKPSKEDTKDLSDVPEQLRKHVEKKQDAADDKDEEEDVCSDCGKAECECDEDDDHEDMVRKSPKSKTRKASVVFNHPSQLSAEAVEAALASGDKALANTILAARHERRVRLAGKIQSEINTQNEKNVKLAQRRAYREQLIKIAEKAEAMNKECESCGKKYAGESCDCSASKKAMNKKCEHCDKKYAGESCGCSASKEAGYAKTDNAMKKANQLSSSAKQAFAAKALAEGFPQEYIDAMLGNETIASNGLKEIKNVMASELNANVKKAAVSSMIKVATLTDSDYSRLVDYWKNELGYGDQEWIDALFTKKYDK